MKHILVIEDDQIDQYIAKTNILKVYPDTEIHMAFDGQQALEWLESVDFKPEIILLDINMPGMNGHDFLEAYAKQHDGKIPVVAMLTSSDQQSDKTRSMAYDFVKDYFIKPVDRTNISMLADIVKQSDNDG